MVVQINGKVRARLEVSPEIGEDDASAAAFASASVVWMLASCPEPVTTYLVPSGSFRYGPRTAIKRA